MRFVRIEDTGQAHRGRADVLAIVTRGNRAVGDAGDQLRLVPKGLPPSGTRCSQGNDFQRSELSRQDGDVAFGILPDLIERFGQQAREAGASRPDA